jgi:hypothetical protein
MGETIASALRVSTAAGLLFLPGSWIAFGRPAAEHPFRARLALAVVLSPLVVVLEFYAFRAIGVSFATTGVALAVMNLPAVLLVARPLRTTRWPGWTAVGVWLSFLAWPAMYLTTWLADTQVRANWGHAWIHTDIVYQLSNGRLSPEEPLLAGARLAYPWLAHVYQGVVSYLVDRPPCVAYLLINVVWLASVIVFVAALVARLGGGLLAQASSSAWLCFGVDWLGALGSRMLPPSVVARNLMFGDVRYTPWLRKFGIFEPTAIGIASFAALLYLLSCHDEEKRGGAPWLLVLTTLLTGGLFYPLLFPASLAAVGGRMLVLVARRGPRPVASGRRELVGLALAAGAGAVATVGYLRVVVMDRAPGAVLGVSDAPMLMVKAAALLVALAPALVALLVDGRSDWRAAPRTTGLLLFGATASMAIYVAADIPHIANEYKFVFTAAVCLAPFPAIALARSLALLRKGAYPLALAAAMILAWPAIAGFRRGGIVGRPGPQLDLAHFGVRLASEEPLSRVLDSIRSATPVNAVVVSQETAFDIATITQRATYVPFSPDMLHGVGLPADYLLKDVRGYPAALVDRRREKVRKLFGATGTPARPAAALEIRNELQRPVVLIVRGEDDPALTRWLSTSPQARCIYRDARQAAWVLEPVMRLPR